MERERNRPNRLEIVQLVSKHMYSDRILNNAHRGDVVEMMVLAALGPEWRFVGLGWHPWDLQRGDGDERVRIQVKQSAARQLWGATRNPTVSLGWKPRPPSYFERDNPGQHIEAEGWFCEIIVVGIHEETDETKIDQLDVSQWKFLVIPTGDLERGQKTMVLSRALAKWPSVPWHELTAQVAQIIETRCGKRRTDPQRVSDLRRTG